MGPAPSTDPNATDGVAGPLPCDNGAVAQTYEGINPPPCDWCEAPQICFGSGCISPVIVDVGINGFNLTDAAGGGVFDIRADGRPLQISWTRAGSDDAWLALDRNQNGAIDSGAELFGNFTAQPPSPTPNGFLALAEYDKPQNGGNNDGLIDNRDTVFASLRLWRDTNHNGISETSELRTLPSQNVNGMELRYVDRSYRDSHGNNFRYHSIRPLAKVG